MSHYSKPVQAVQLNCTEKLVVTRWSHTAVHHNTDIAQVRVHNLSGNVVAMFCVYCSILILNPSDTLVMETIPSSVY